jgi:hydrogenase nickel incorporation protein HypA/HybF
MHELSIAMSIVDIAEEEAQKANIKKFSAIELEIGTLSGIVMEALDFAWPEAVKNSVLENAERSISEIKAVAQCNDCGHKFEAQTLYDACPECGSYFTRLIQGKELRIKSLTVDY